MLLRLLPIQLRLAPVIVPVFKHGLAANPRAVGSGCVGAFLPPRFPHLVFI